MLKNKILSLNHFFIYYIALNTSLFRPNCIALMLAKENIPASALCTHHDCSEPATQSVVAAHYACIQLKPRIYSYQWIQGYAARDIFHSNIVST